MSKEHDFRDYKKRRLSASADGRGVKVAATASPGTVMHTALSSAAANEWDEVWLYATNSSGSPVVLTIQWGGTGSPDDEIKISIPSQSGLTQITPGLVLQNGKEIRAFAGAANVVILHGFVNRYENTQ